ncbi:hypothetical protein BKA81DRAFT_364231, partial [Phyllosticta paracitricarpa]
MLSSACFGRWAYSQRSPSHCPFGMGTWHCVVCSVPWPWWLSPHGSKGRGEWEMDEAVAINLGFTNNSLASPSASQPPSLLPTDDKLPVLGCLPIQSSWYHSSLPQTIDPALHLTAAHLLSHGQKRLQTRPFYCLPTYPPPTCTALHDCRLADCLHAYGKENEKKKKYTSGAFLFARMHACKVLCTLVATGWLAGWLAGCTPHSSL